MNIDFCIGMRMRVVELLSRSLPRAVLYRAPAAAEATLIRPTHLVMDFLCKAAGCLVWLLVVIAILPSSANAQGTISKVWVADNGDGTYRNPILHADYSDPDVVRVGDDFYLISFEFQRASRSADSAIAGSGELEHHRSRLTSATALRGVQ